MKTTLFIIFSFFQFSLFAQQKGVSPVQSAVGSQQSGSTYAVVVGISDYQDEGIPDLRFADKDALAFAGFLQSSTGGSLDKDHLKVLINEKATQAQFGAALDWLWEVATENDKVIIYFSGHGDVERKSITQPGYLLCWDAPPNVYMGGGAFNVRDLNDVVSTISIQNKAKVILVTDACRAGKLSGSGIGGSQATTANLAKQYGNEIKILSCQPDEYSIEGEQWGGGRGAFSYHLLDGLYGMADGNGDLSVSLLEIGRYLEDHVSREVAPQSQIPMTVGGRGEKLTTIFPEILAQLKEGKRGQMQLFSATESRGIEDEVLIPMSIGTDSNIVEMYYAFQKALEDKHFLTPQNACADVYFDQLIKEPKLKRLHSSMRRNYAAALQDDAQQEMNIMLKSGLTKKVLKDANAHDIYKNFPDHLQRAAELLGKEHYMYNRLQARQLYFKAISQKSAKVARSLYHKALALEPDMPHVMTSLILASGADKQLDSAEYYFQRAIEMIPSWVQPYIDLSIAYGYVANLDKAEELLRMAGKIDSSAVNVWYYTANVLKDQGKYEEAVKFYKRVIETTAEGICFPCANNNLGWTYAQLNQYEEAEKQYKKAIQLDSSFTRAYGNLVYFYLNAQRYEEAEKIYKKAPQIDSSNIYFYIKMGYFYRIQSQNEKARTYLNKGLSIDSTNVSLIWTLAWVIYTTEGAAAANTLLDKGIAQQTYDGDKATLLYVKGFLEYYSNHLNESLVALRQAAVINSSYQPFVLAVEKLVEKDYESAAANFEKAMEKNPGADNIKYIYCQLKIEQGDLEGALDLLETALSIGGRTYDFMINDPKLEPLRQLPRYQKLMQKYFPDQHKN